MHETRYTGTEWIEGFFLLAGALWLIGALFIGGLATIGAARLTDASAYPASDQSPVANSPQTQ